MKYRYHSFSVLLILLIAFQNVLSQQYQIDNEQSEMKVAGTSTLHDWHSDVLEIGGDAEIITEEDQISDIKELAITVRVKSIKSGKNGMDKNAWEALKETEHPEIQFTLTRIEEIYENKILSVGLLTIAGATREVKMNVNYDISDSNRIEFEGDLDLNMTDYDIDPPSALLGTVKTGDPVTIQFKVNFNKG